MKKIILTDRFHSISEIIRDILERERDAIPYYEKAISLGLKDGNKKGIIIR